MLFVSMAIETLANTKMDNGVRGKDKVKEEREQREEEEEEEDGVGELPEKYVPLESKENGGKEEKDNAKEKESKEVNDEIQKGK